MRRRLLFVVAVAATVALAACAPAAPAEGPVATVAQALDKLAARDLDGLRGLACAGQEDTIRQQLGLPGAMGEQLLPGLDTQALLDAVRFDVSGVEAGEPTIEADVAEVPVSGTLKVTFDAAAMRPIVRQVLEGQGRTMTDDQLDALLDTLQAYGQEIPVDQTVRLVREDGAWKICQDAVVLPTTP